MALFLIGAGMTRGALKRVGVRPLVMGVVLWVFAATIAAVIVMRMG